MTDIKNTADLREMLIKTIEEVRSGKLEPKAASTIAVLSKTVLQSAKIDLDYLRFNSKSLTPTAPLQLVLEPAAAPPT